MKTAIIIYLKYVDHYQRIPYTLTLNRAEDIGEDAVKLEEGLNKSLREHIEHVKANDC